MIFPQEKLDTLDKTRKFIELTQKLLDCEREKLRLGEQLLKCCRMSEFADMPVKDMHGKVSMSMWPPCEERFLPRFKKYEMRLHMNGETVAAKPLLDTHHSLWPAEMLQKWEAHERAEARRKERNG